MALPKAYTNNYGKIAGLLRLLREGTAPDTFNRSHLRDLGFKSSHDFTIIQVLKELGFLSADGKPTSRYMDYLDKSRHRSVLGQAVKEAYRDLFVIRASPQKSDMGAIEGKFKSEFNSSDSVAKYRANTFFSLLSEADIDQKSVPKTDAGAKDQTEETEESGLTIPSSRMPVAGIGSTTFHYNIQIHLPPTKDVEVYNAIFKSLKEHLID